MKKLFSAIIITGLMLYLPLWGNFMAMRDVKLLFPTICSLWLLMKQEALDWKKIKENAKTDRYSTIFIVIAGMISQTLPIIEWRLKDETCCGYLSLTGYFGVFMLFSGLFLRIKAVDDLKNFFTNEVRIVRNAKLIQTGIYKYIRHGSYLGAFICLLGSSILFESYKSLIFNTFLLLAVYIFRIRLEEKALLMRFGNKFLKYRKRTWAFFPYVY